MPRFLDLLSSGLALLLPRECPVCAGDLPWNAPAGICCGCWSGIRPLLAPLCDRCGHPLGSFPANPPPHTCIPCGKNPPPFRSARSLGSYDDSLREILKQFKYTGRTEIGPILGTFMVSCLRLQMPAREWDGVIPVPLHRYKQWQRGFNPAEILARSVARATGLPLLRRILVRIRPTSTQASLPKSERRRNVRNAFRVRRCGSVRGRTLLLVDDVLTTGATAAECSGQLLRSGARAVDLLTAARTLDARAWE